MSAYTNNPGYIQRVRYKFDPGDHVIVKGDRDPHTGLTGNVVGRDGYAMLVKLDNSHAVYKKWQRNLRKVPDED